ncbi:hypothetical protein GTW51_16125 [Aurantimonas aggregata]|uniref:Phage tail protein n=1 Tax=Aurantimonas aggregata TaxID=2047720 RepID=A0A6L9MKY9_9HYPH|nr:phage tail protein [Aurantimonas aggregata]NDV88228.1 hypothetical protein [Aurantimonas aggregata]
MPRSFPDTPHEDAVTVGEAVAALADASFDPSPDYNVLADLVLEDGCRLTDKERADCHARGLAIASRALNHTGKIARTQVRRALAKQTGLKRDVIVRAVKVSPSSPATLRYRMDSAGDDIALKYFAARETRRGVSAAPFGKRQVFAGTFLKGGRFPNRKAIGKYGGNVMKRVGSGRYPLEVQVSGVIIPAEMVKGQTAEAFTSTIGQRLPPRLDREVQRMTNGVMS